jgi:hypothetical protein
MQWLNGKKSIIALILWMADAVYRAIFGQGLDNFEPPSWAEASLEIVATVFTVVGLAHKAWKKYVVVSK